MGMVHSKTLWTIGLGVSALYLLYEGRAIYRWFVGNNRVQSTPIRGLRNLGQTCYLNAVLQALAACTHFNAWLENKDDHNRSDFPPRLHLPSEYVKLDYPVIALLYRALLVINRVIENDESDHDLIYRVPKDIIETMRRLKRTFVDYHEQDTLECLQYLLNILHEELVKYKRASQRGSLDCILDEDDASEVSGELLTEPVEPIPLPPPPPPAPLSMAKRLSFSEASSNLSSWDFVYDGRKAVNGIYSKRKTSQEINIPLPPKMPFRGLSCDVFQCMQCLHKLRTKHEIFDSLTLNVPYQSKFMPRLTLRSLLEDLQKPTLVHQVDCEGCSKKADGKPMKSLFSKVLRFVKLPQILVLHVNQILWTKDGIAKRPEFVSYEEEISVNKFKLWPLYRNRRPYRPPEGRAMAAALVGAGDSTIDGSNVGTALETEDDYDVYELKAIIAHSGDAESGHFVTCRRVPETPWNIGRSQWAWVSDDEVEELDSPGHLQLKPYILFYERSIKKSQPLVAHGRS